jgi:hypothetical protein
MKRSKVRKILRFMIMLSLICLPISVMAAQIEIDDQQGPMGSDVEFTMYLDNPPQGTDNLSMEITYDPDVLKFVSADFAGTLLGNFDSKEVTSPKPGVLQLNAKTGHNPINGGAKGALVKIKFTVSGSDDCELAIKNLKSGVSTWSTQPGNFKFFKPPAT